MGFDSVSLTVYVVGIGGAALALTGLLLGLSASDSRRAVAGIFCPLAAAILAGAAWLLGQPSWMAQALAAFAGLAALCQIGRWPRLARRLATAGTRLADPRWSCAVLLVACPLLALAWIKAVYEAGSQPEQKASAVLSDSDAPPGKSLAASAVTDRGQPVRLLRMVDDRAPAEKIGTIDSTLEWLNNVPEGVILTAPGHLGYNCYGWVFTGGRFWLSNTDGAIQKILDDNGYAAVSVPQEDDLAIYRSKSGDIVHVGLVRAASDDGPTLVESKWGPLDRFVHTADHLPASASAPFSFTCTYYRSSRRGHLLRGLEATPETGTRANAAAQSNPSR